MQDRRAAQRHHRLLRRPGLWRSGVLRQPGHRHPQRGPAGPGRGAHDRLLRLQCHLRPLPGRAVDRALPLSLGCHRQSVPKDEPFTRRAAREYVGGSLQGLGALDLQEGEVVAGIPARELLLGEALQTAGYRTAMVGKWHLGDYSIDAAYNPRRNGFDFYLGLPHSNDMLPCPLYRNEEMLQANIGTDQAKLTGLYTQEAVRFIKEAGREPFFLYVAHTFPHQPLYASAQFAGQSKAGKIGDAVEEFDWSVGRI